jgi:hypothetical protein
VDASEYSRAIRKARSDEDRIARFGALLSTDSGTNVEIVGGSAIEIYLSSAAYASQDIDLVGDRAAIEQALQKWGFRPIDGRSRRTYWTDGFVGLIDLVGSVDSSGLPPRRIPTAYGPVWLSAPEPLIVRRLYRSKREGSRGLFLQAVALARLGNLDWDYLVSEARYEGVELELRRLRSAARP